MHELGITQSIVETCCAEAGDEPVARVLLELGCLCGLAPDAVRFCYDVCVQGTPLAGSVLDILTVAGRARCRDCSNEMAVRDWLAICRCGSANLEYAGGDELRLKELEMA